VYWLQADKKETSSKKAKIFFMVVALDVSKISIFLLQTNLNGTKKRLID
jgi:hypothetical protein